MFSDNNSQLVFFMVGTRTGCSNTESKQHSGEQRAGCKQRVCLPLVAGVAGLLLS